EEVLQINTTPPDLLSNTVSRTIPTSIKSFIFPKTNGRCFRVDWFQNFKWLEYSIVRDAAFCFPCRMFAPTHPKSKTFAITGFNSWKNALNKSHGFYKHESTSIHKNCMCTWEERLKANDGAIKPVSELLSSIILEKRRFFMKAIIDVIIFLVENELAFKGEWDDENHIENGVFRHLFEFKLKDSEQLRVCEKSMPRNATYLSPQIQNEIIEILARMVQQAVVHDINDADVEFFTLLVDGTKDRSHTECVSIAGRYLKNGQLQESLISLETTEKFDAKTNAELVLQSLEDCGLDSKRILSQCYDGANVMSGDDGGMQRIIQIILRRLIPYVHCFNHRLHLVIVFALDNVNMVRLFFDNIKLVYTFFHRPKIQILYQGSAILKVIETRWAGHVRATNAIYENYTEIVNVLPQVREKCDMKFDADDIAIATGLQRAIQTPKQNTTVQRDIISRVYANNSKRDE
ncbi:Zinc finger MYM-type protein 1, partial [Pseudolycoriella hygida]